MSAITKGMRGYVIKANDHDYKADSQSVASRKRKIPMSPSGARYDPLTLKDLSKKKREL